MKKACLAVYIGFCGCTGCRQSSWPVDGCGDVFVGQSRTAQFFGGHREVLASVEFTPHWITSTGKRISAKSVVDRVSSYLTKHELGRRRTLVHVSRSDPLVDYRARGGSYPGFDRTIVVFNLEPISGVVIERPIADINMWLWAGKVREDYWGDSSDVCVLPNGIWASTDLGEYRPTKWFAIGWTEGFVDFESDTEMLRMPVDRIVFEVTLKDEKWIIERSGG